jgi:hypothetical protein
MAHIQSAIKPRKLRSPFNQEMLEALHNARSVLVTAQQGRVPSTDPKETEVDQTIFAAIDLLTASASAVVKIDERRG